MTREPHENGETRSARDDPEGFASARNRRAVDGMPACNIVLLGKTGAGKSTLLNAVFGTDLAETGVGRPVTRHLQEHRVAGLPVTIVDTRGIELSDEADAIRDEFDAEIDLRLRGHVDQRLHALWYCVSSEGGRFEADVEASLLEHLARRLPAIVVITRVYDTDDDQYAALRAEIERHGLPLETIVPVLALERKIGPVVLPAHGLQELVRTTTACVPEGVRRAFVNGQVVELEEKLEAALARVDELADEADTAYRPLAFLRGTVIGGATGADVMLARVLTVAGEVAAIFGSATVSDETVRALAAAAVGEASGDDAVQALLRLVNRILILVPPVGPAGAAKYGAKLVASLGAALVANQQDLVARKRAALLSRVIGRAMARTFADCARAELERRTPARTEVRTMFDAHVEAEAMGADAS